MRAIDFLIEYNEQALANLLGTKILAKWKAEGEPFKNEINSSGEVTPNNILTWISQYDPTRNGSYVKWLAQLYIKNNGIRKLEDIPSRAHDLLIRYEELKKSRKLKSPDNNINQIKSINQLYDIIDKYKEVDTTSNKQQDKELTNKLYQSGAIEVLYNGPDYLIAIPHTIEASCYLGKHTKWCTAANTHNRFAEYNNEGNLYDILDKKNNKRWLFHFERHEYMDELDNPINVDEFIKTHKKVVNIILKNYGGLEKAATADLMTWFKYIKNPSDAATLTAVENTLKGGVSSMRIPEAALVIAIRQKWRLLKWIRPPSPAVQLAAVEANVIAFEILLDREIVPSEAVQLAAVKQDGNLINYIKNPSLDVQLASTKQSGIKYVRPVTPEEQKQIDSIKIDIDNYVNIIDPSISVQLALINEYGAYDALSMIQEYMRDEDLEVDEIDDNIIRNIRSEDPPEEVQLLAVSDQGDTIALIHYPSERVQMAAVKEDGYAIASIHYPSERVQMAAVKENGYAIEFIKNPSEAVRRAAELNK